MQNLNIALALGLLQAVLSSECFADYDLLSNFSYPGQQSYERTSPFYLAIGSGEPKEVADSICKGLISEQGLKEAETSFVQGSNPILVFNTEKGEFFPFLDAPVKDMEVRVFSKLVCLEDPEILLLRGGQKTADSKQILKNLANRESLYWRLKQEKVEPTKLITELYQEKQVILIGEPHHHVDDNGARDLFLEQIIAAGPELKFIAIEAPMDLALFFKEASVKTVDASLIQKTIPDPKMQRYLFGPQFPRTIHPQGAMKFDIDFLFPLIKEMNTYRRDPKNPVIIYPIDSEVTAFTRITKTGFVKNGINVPQQLTLKVGAVSRDREEGTAKNFEAVMDLLEPGEKGLVLYHFGHLMQGFQGRLPQLNFEEKRWEASPDWHPFNFLSFYLADHPEKRKDLGIVLVDESDDHREEKPWAPSMLLGLSMAASVSDPGSFAISLPRFKEVEEDAGRGMTLFQPQSVLRSNPFYLLKSDAGLSDLGDALVIISPKSSGKKSTGK